MSQNYINVEGPHQQLAKSIYNELRQNLIKNIHAVGAYCQIFTFFQEFGRNMSVPSIYGNNIPLLMAMGNDRTRLLDGLV